MLIRGVYAQVKVEDYFEPAKRPGGFKTVGDIVNVFAQNVLIVGGVIFFIMIIYAGFMLVSHAGSEDAQTMQKWKGLLTNALIGFVIIFSAFWILQIINGVTGGSLGDLF